MSGGASEETLFERLGGAAAIQAAVDIFYVRVTSDPQVSQFFLELDMEAQARKMVAFMAWAFGGPEIYRGRPLGEAHRELVRRGLNDLHFDAVLHHLEQTLREMKVNDSLVRDVLALVEGTRGVVLGRQDG